MFCADTVSPPSVGVSVRWRSLEGRLLYGVMEVMLCANEFLPSVPNADTPSMLRDFRRLFVASAEKLRYISFPGLLRSTIV